MIEHYLFERIFMHDERDALSMFNYIVRRDNIHSCVERDRNRTFILYKICFLAQEHVYSCNKFKKKKKKKNNLKYAATSFFYFL